MSVRKPLTEDDERHGTYAGAQVHRRQGIPLCEPCRLARNQYRTTLYKDGRTHDREYRRATQRALTRLKHLHPADFQRLHNEELEGGGST